MQSLTQYISESLDSSVNEDRRFDDFKESKHGKRILEITKGKFDAKKIMDYMDDELSDSIKSDTQWVRVIEFIAKDLGIDHKKFDNKPIHKLQKEIINKLKVYLS